MVNAYLRASSYRSVYDELIVYTKAKRKPFNMLRVGDGDAFLDLPTNRLFIGSNDELDKYLTEEVKNACDTYVWAMLESETVALFSAKGLVGRRVVNRPLSSTKLPLVPKREHP